MLFTCLPEGARIPGRFPGPAHARGKWFTVDIHCHVTSLKAATMVDNFALQWLQLKRLQISAPDAKRFPAFNDGLRRAMLSLAGFWKPRRTRAARRSTGRMRCGPGSRARRPSSVLPTWT